MNFSEETAFFMFKNGRHHGAGSTRPVITGSLGPPMMGDARALVYGSVLILDSGFFCCWLCR